MLGGKLPIFGTSFAIHAVIAGIFAWLAVDQVRRRPDPQMVEFELIESVPAAPEPLELPPVAPPEPPAPTPRSRPEVVPQPARVVEVDRARPFTPEIVSGGEREAPDDVEAADAPETTLVFDMESRVGGGAGDYVSTSTGGTTAVAAGGRGGGDGGGGGGRLGATDRPGRGDLAVARDWEVTVLPEPVNDRDFEPRYPPLARREAREAAIVVELGIDRTGAVAAARIVRGPRGHGFGAAALAYARKLRFKPALAGSRPVAARIEWTVYFYARN